MLRPKLSLHWLEPGESFPPVHQAWGPESDAPGLLAAGGELSVQSLVTAYSNGIFPWFSFGQPILWWSPDPRMVLVPSNFQLHHALRKTLKRFRRDPSCELRVDSAFKAVIHACADFPRKGQKGTWIIPDMVDAYCELHEAGFAHSFETWKDDKLVGGLYCVAIGKAVFGESMFAHATDASKIALAGLVAFCMEHNIPQIDCQQNTSHLASLGAAEISRARFMDAVANANSLLGPDWKFSPLYWNHLL